MQRFLVMWFNPIYIHTLNIAKLQVLKGALITAHTAKKNSALCH
jgi:hypothetical protein